MVTVQEILERPLFRTARIVAGHAGLTRSVEWVHIGEIPQLADFLKGGELVLTTGYGLTTDDRRHQFLKGLITVGASGLVLELGSSLPDVPPDMMALADAHHFPVIVFHHPVRFLELSQDVNGLLISRHHRILDDLETLALRLRQTLLNTEGPNAIVACLYELLEVPVLYRPRDDLDPPITWGTWEALPGPFKDIALNPLLEEEGGQGPVYLRQTVLVFGQPRGDLVVKSGTARIDERLYLALDHTTAALAQDLIRVETLERTRRREDAVLLERLLFDEEPDPILYKRFRARYHLEPHHTYRLFVSSQGPNGALEKVLLHLTDSATVARLEESSRVVAVVIGRETVIRNLPDQLAAWARKLPQLGSLGLSALHTDPAQLRDAFSEAHDALLVSQCHASDAGVASYDRLGVYRWILAVSRQDAERLLIEPELATLFKSGHDAALLLDTLDTLLTHIDSKLAAAATLGIHRQTLYSRIQLLQEILGPDFLSPERRLALQLAITAYRFWQRHR